jgi:two-component system LytT family sensor kinase
MVQFMVYFRVGGDKVNALVEAVVTTLILALVGIVLSNTYRYYSPVMKRYYLLLSYTIIVHLLAFRCQIFFFEQYYENDPHQWQVFYNTLPFRGLFNLLMIALLSVYFWYRKNQRDEEESKRRKLEAEKLSREAELSKLRLQLQPHFLFNSLNSISALAGSKPDQARKMIQQLSDFLRGTLRKDDQQLTPLKDELFHLQLYLDIEKVRFGHRLNSEINCDEDASDMLLPALLLQPIVENAVKFGLYDTIGEITITIKAVRENGHLKIQVTNPFDASTSRPRKGTGFGLSSVDRRLYLLYARNDLLATEVIDNNFITTILIPQSSS